MDAGKFSGWPRVQRRSVNLSLVFEAGFGKRENELCNQLKAKLYSTEEGDDGLWRPGR